jgi:hypothetical protein
MMRRPLPGIAAVAVLAAASLAASSSALARAGDRTVDQTYPVATAVCAKAHTGTLPPRLAPQAAAVIGACETLENAFRPLVASVDAAEAQFLAVVSAQKGFVAAACTRPVSNHAACRSARASARAAIISARGTRQGAVLSFHTAVEGNRKAFWNAIGALRGTSPTG